jgi:1-acyl-sn-glycerol-3-phosphate acyltransferase
MHSVPLVLARLLLFLVAAGVAVVVIPLQLLVTPSKRRRQVLRRTLHLAVNACFRLFGFDQITIGAPPPPDQGPMLVVANHRTGMDSAVVENMVDAVSLAKARIASWPLFGRLASARGTMFLNKEGAGSRVSAMRSIRSALSEGNNVLVFPEGVIQPGDEVGPFHRGSFAAARDCHVLCIGLAYPPDVEWLKQEPMPMHLWKLLWRGHIPVGVAVGEPVPILSDSLAAADDARRRTSALVAKARAALEAHEN